MKRKWGLLGFQPLAKWFTRNSEWVLLSYAIVKSHIYWCHPFKLFFVIPFQSLNRLILCIHKMYVCLFMVQLHVLFVYLCNSMITTVFFLFILPKLCVIWRTINMCGFHFFSLSREKKGGSKLSDWGNIGIFQLV